MFLIETSQENYQELAKSCHQTKNFSTKWKFANLKTDSAKPIIPISKIINGITLSPEILLFLIKILGKFTDLDRPKRWNIRFTSLRLIKVRMISKSQSTRLSKKLINKNLHKYKMPEVRFWETWKMKKRSLWILKSSSYQKIMTLLWSKYKRTAQSGLADLRLTELSNFNMRLIKSEKRETKT